jgi:CHAT domain-containing protein
MIPPMRKLLCFVCLLLPLMALAQPETAVLRQQLDSLSKAALQLAGQRSFDQALEINTSALRLARDSGGLQSALYGDACLDRGVIFLQKGDYPQAETQFLESEKVYIAALGPEHRLRVLAADNLSDVYLRIGNFEKSEYYHLLVKDIREKTSGKNHKDYISALGNLANLYTEMGEFERADPLYIENLHLREQLNGKDHRDYATALNNWGLNFLKSGRHRLAEPLLLEAFHIRERVLGKQHPHYASSLNNLGQLYTEKGDYERAEPFLIQAKDARREIFGEQHPAYSWSLNNLAQFYLAVASYDKSEPLLREAIELKAQTLGLSHPDYAKSLLNLARLHARKGHYELAEPLLLEGLRIYADKLNEQHPDYLSGLHYLAVLYADMGKNDEAEQILLQEKKAREQSGGTSHPQYALCLQTLGELDQRNSHWAKAENHYAEAAAILNQSVGAVHPAQAGLSRQNAYLYRAAGQYERAAQHAIEAATIEQTLLMRAVRYMSERDLTAYAESLSETRPLLYELAAWQPSLTGLCYDDALFIKGFLLNAASEIRRLAASDSLASEKMEELRAWHRRLAAEYVRPVSERKNVTDWVNQAEVLEKELTRTVAGYAQAVQKTTWQEVQQALQPGEAAVEFVHYQMADAEDSTMYAALVVRPGWPQPRWVALFEEKKLAALLSASQGENKAEWIQNLYAGDRYTRLYDLVWQPLEAVLQDVTTVHYSVSGLLHRIPLDAVSIPPLLRGEERSETLSDRYQLLRLNSTRSLAHPVSPSVLGGDALIYGGIDYETDTLAAQTTTPMAARSPLPDSTLRGEGWGYLKWTEVETAAIASILTEAGMNALLYQGRQATEASLKQAATPRILHIATHGYFFPDPVLGKQKLDQATSAVKSSEQPLIRSGLILAGGNYAWKYGRPLQTSEEDGILTAYEISQMDLSTTELAVLSACETGLGELRGYEGVYGLQRAFKLAGSRYLLMSLWQVPDFQTQELMTAFYTKMIDDQMSIPDAFQAARQALRKKYPNPFYWAGFVLVE